MRDKPNDLSEGHGPLKRDHGRISVVLVPIPGIPFPFTRQG